MVIQLGDYRDLCLEHPGQVYGKDEGRVRKILSLERYKIPQTGEVLARVREIASNIVQAKEQSRNLEPNSLERLMEINFTGDIVREISAAKTTRIAELEECAQGATIRTKKHEELLRIYAASFPLQCLSERNPTTPNDYNQLVVAKLSEETPGMYMIYLRLVNGFLPKEEEIESFIRGKTIKSDPLSVSCAHYNKDRIREIMRTIYAGLRKQKRVSEIKDITRGCLDNAVIQTLQKLHQMHQMQPVMIYILGLGSPESNDGEEDSAPLIESPDDEEGITRALAEVARSPVRN
ncbi:MAG TPA: hypothetical protein VJG90_02805 [Candidatus Nanoarchaeia archaeon]|nr:hypothetical protein [Candidatus Nanoarchaeia archaeon]